MRDWLRETHGPGTELLRHFLFRFFDSDLVTAPGQTTTALIGAFSIFLPWFPLIVGPLRHKYAYFSGLAIPDPYRQAVRADELWLITLMMSAIGLLTAVKWQSLFPGLRDYYALGSLPLRAREIFAAKLLALLLVATAAVVTLNALPAMMFPAVSSGRWAFRAELGPRVAAHIIAAVAACYFFCFGLVALQGVLLNLLRPRQFARVTGHAPGTTRRDHAGSACSEFLHHTAGRQRIGPAGTRALASPGLVSRALPGDVGRSGPGHARARPAGVVGACHRNMLTLATYTASYRRHRQLLMEGAANTGKDRRWHAVVFEWLVPDPRQQAVIAFLTKTLAGSAQHRMILMGYGGFGLALFLSGTIGMRELVDPARLLAANFVYAHVILLAFLLMGIRHLFSIPVELKANWAFRITEGEGRREWLRAIDRFVLFWGAMVMLGVGLPLEIKLLGWRAVAEVLLSAAFGLLCYEWAFSSWEKLPFTCSHLPGKTPMWIRALQLFALLGFLPIVNALLLACLFQPAAFAAALIALSLASMRMRASRPGSLAGITLAIRRRTRPRSPHPESPQMTVGPVGDLRERLAIGPRALLAYAPAIRAATVKERGILPAMTLYTAARSFMRSTFPALLSPAASPTDSDPV